ncbi:MAG TPA: hypothetical protein VK530_05260, partial [Candidatus Acidoferrum sp.]|nr:hypothetical protein [Candidatus Acidoferrum sp.]
MTTIDRRHSRGARPSPKLDRMMPFSPHCNGFTRIDLLATIALAILLLSTTMAVTSRESSQRAVCHNNLRQLGVAALQFAEENNDMLPPRRASPQTWIQQLKPYYKDEKVIQCPTGRDEITPHSYLINGFNDYFRTTLSADEFNNIYMSWLWPKGMRIE